jgi:hypothetical protein
MTAVPTIPSRVQFPVFRRVLPVPVIHKKGTTEQQMVQSRIDNLGSSYQTMATFLCRTSAWTHERFTQAYLRRLANNLMRVWICAKVDRMAQRRKPAFICWFCENCPDLPYFSVILWEPVFRPARPSTDAVVYQTRDQIPPPSDFMSDIMDWRGFNESDDSWDMPT